MSYVNRILSAMRYDQEYTPDEVAAITHVDRYETFKALKLLSQGGLVETVGADRFIKKPEVQEQTAGAETVTADTRNYLIEQDGKVTPYPEVDDEGFITIYDSTAEERVKRIKAICERCGYMQFIEEAE